MLRKMLLILTMLLFGTSSAIADDESQLLKEVGNRVNFINQNTQNVWPGFQINEPVVLFYYYNADDMRSYALNNFKPLSAYFYQTCTYYNCWQGKTAEDINYFVIDGYDYLKLAGPHMSAMTKIENQPVFAFTHIGTLAELLKKATNKFLYDRFLVYERSESPAFKTYIAAMTNQPYEALYNADNIKLMYLQLDALQEFANDKIPDATRYIALKYYAAINKVRLAALSTASQQYEHNNGLLHATASYVNWRYLQEADTDYLKRISSECAIPEIVNLPALMMQLSKGMFSPIEHFSLHYIELTGPTVGSALSFLDKQKNTVWQKEVETRGISPNELLLERFPMTVAMAQALVDEAKIRYAFHASNYSENAAKVDQLLNGYADVIKTQKEGYNAQSGIEVVINLPVWRVSQTDAVWLTLKSKNEPKKGSHLQLDDQTYLAVNTTGQIYWLPRDLFINGPTPAINYKNMSYLFVSELPGNVLSVRFKAQPGDLITLDGAAKKIADFMGQTTVKPISGAFSIYNNAVNTTYLRVADGEIKSVNGRLVIDIRGLQEN